MPIALTKVALHHVRRRPRAVAPDTSRAPTASSTSTWPSRARPTEPTANPETLFAAGYAACFQGALANRAKTQDIDTSDSTVTAEVSFGPTEDGGVGLAVALKVEHPGRRPGQGPGAGRARPPVLPVLEGHPRQHRGHAHRRLSCRRSCPAAPMAHCGSAHDGSWPSACSTCSRSASARRRRTPSARCGRRGRSRSGLADDGCSDGSPGCGSSCSARWAPPATATAATARSSSACSASARDGRHRRRSRDRVGGGPRGRARSRCSASTTAALGRRRPGPAPARRACRSTRTGCGSSPSTADGALLRERTYYSVGGGFVVDEAAAGADRIKADDTAAARTRSRTGAQLLARCAETGLPISGVMLANETGLAHRGRGPRRAARDLGGHAAVRAATAARTRARCPAG